jgi:hypothetical protein
MVILRSFIGCITLLLAGCAGAAPGAASLTEGAPVAAQASQVAAAKAGATSGGYQLTAEEQALDCKKITGRMQIRILQLRGFDPAKSQGSLIGSMFGSKSPAARYEQEKAQLEAYNTQLAAKKCPVFNLAEELNIQDTKHTPVPKPAAK